MAEPVLIWGAGAIGGSIGAWLKRAGHDVTFVDVVPDHVAAIANPVRGLRITGPIETFTVTAPARLPAEVSGQWPRIFLAVKAQDTEAATLALAPFLADDGYVLSLQNGLNENIIAGIVGRGRTIGAFINFAADWMGSGEIMFGNRGAAVLGELEGDISPRLQALHAHMCEFEPGASVTSDIWAYLWGKLGYGSMLFAQALGEAGKARVKRGGTHSQKTIVDFVYRNIDRDSILLTDDLPAYRWIGRKFGAHLAVNHSRGEYVRHDRYAAATAHVNTAESFNAILKRCWIGVRHWWSIKHSHRYLNQIVYHWNHRGTATTERLTAIFSASGQRLWFRECVQ